MRRWNSVGALGGVIFVVLVIISFAIMGEPPDHEEPVSEISDFYVDNESQIWVSTGLAMLALMFFLLFANHLRRLFGAAGDAPLAAFPLVGATILATGVAIDATIQVALVEAVDELDDSGIQTLQALWDNDFVPMAFGAAVFLGASGISIIQTGVLPKWLGWIGIVFLILTFTPAGFVAFLGGAIWIIIASVMLAIREGKEPPPARPAAATPQA